MAEGSGVRALTSPILSRMKGGDLMAIALDNAYNYYVSTYGQSLTPSRYDTHKKSDLRNVYNSMLKLNKDAPLYKIANHFHHLSSKKILNSLLPHLRAVIPPQPGSFFPTDTECPFVYFGRF